MKIKVNQRIQAEVDVRKGSRVARLCDLYQPATGKGRGAFGPGVEAGVRLAGAIIWQLSRTNLLLVPDANTFGVYLATRHTRDGDDLLYFIGSVEQIVAKLRRVKADR